MAGEIDPVRVDDAAESRVGIDSDEIGRPPTGVWLVAIVDLRPALFQPLDEIAAHSCIA
jgi:hypothetical protein